MTDVHGTVVNESEEFINYRDKGCGVMMRIAYVRYVVLCYVRHRRAASFLFRTA